MVPNLGLSDEAIGMLRLLAKSESGELFSPGEGQLTFSQLITDRGKPFYRLTRRGAQFFMLPESNS